MKQKLFAWSSEKNDILKSQRGISFEEVVFQIAGGQLLDILEHPNQEKYAGQRIFVLRVRDYVWLVPFVETEDEVFLKTAIPSRKATRKYLRREHAKE